MAIDGIYTLANDVVYDQAVALLNSIEVWMGKEMPVCIVAYDDRVDKLRAEVATRENVTLLDDRDLFATWEDFSLRLWQTHPHAIKTWREKGITTPFYRVGENHRYVAFDPRAPFDRFIYLDADTLVLNSLQYIFEELDSTDVVAYDFQRYEPQRIFNVESPKLEQVLGKERLEKDIFCSGFFASKRGLLDENQREEIISHLADGEAEVLYLWAPNQSVLNYMVIRSGLNVRNLSTVFGSDRVTGCCANSPHFEMKDWQLYDRGKPLTYLHYISISSKVFRDLCAGENIDFPYRELFLHYRYLHEPEKRPKFTSPPHYYKQPPTFFEKMLKKLKLKT